MKQPKEWSEDQIAYRSQVEAARLMGWITRADGHCFYLSPQWYEFTGHEQGEAEGFGWLDAINPEDRARTSEAFFSATAAQLEYGVEYRIRSRSGRFVTAWAHGKPVFDVFGKFAGFVGLTNPLPGVIEQLSLPVNEDPAAPVALSAAKLSRRERDILGYIAAGLTAERISERLGIKPRTVEAHAQRAARRLGATNRVHACVTALQLNEIGYPPRGP